MSEGEPYDPLSLKTLTVSGTCGFFRVFFFVFFLGFFRVFFNLSCMQSARLRVRVLEFWVYLFV